MNDSVIAAATTAIVVSLIITVGLYVWTSLALQAVFRKTGEQGWKAWVPVYNTVILLQLGGQSGWWMLCALVPGVSIVLYVMLIIACHRINQGFGYGAGMTVLAALLLPVWASVVGWSSNRWVGVARSSGHGPVRTGSAAATDEAALGWLAQSTPSYSPSYSPPSYGPAPSYPPEPAPPTAAMPRPAPAAPVAPPIHPLPPLPNPAAGGGHETAPSSGAERQEPPLPPAADAPPAAGVALTPGLSPGSSADEPGPFAESAPVEPAAVAEPPLSRLPLEISPTGYVPFDEEDVDDDSGGIIADSLATSSVWPDVPRRTRRAGFSAPPATPHPAAAPSPWAPPAATRPPLLSPEPNGAFSDTSGEVSAVAGAPALGSPMSARSSVSARRRANEIPDADDLFDETVIASRKRTPWTLVPPLGAPIAITHDVVIVGRRPSVDPENPDAQRVSIADETRTMSKTHARLELRDGTWVITDLDSTNGVALIDVDGGEIEAAPGRPLPVIERFLLGDAELRLLRDGE
ncbi:DUF5684 domain-containing protein [Microbacterium sp.]|uniref:DUF5684 domain-containing protein n=1 Tax=Microbacterium sp. TaxID=51671 RepID=UPI003A918636